MQVPNLEAESSSCIGVDNSSRTLDQRFTGKLGTMVWGASFALAEFLSRHSNLAQVEELKELMEARCMWWSNWKLKSGVELGAGLGLPSIVASNLGAEMIATDGDDEVLKLLSLNMVRNAPSCRVEK